MNKDDEIGALWDQVAKSGAMYLSGSIDMEKLVREWKPEQGSKFRIVVFPNNHRQNKAQPELRLYIDRRNEHEPKRHEGEYQKSHSEGKSINDFPTKRFADEDVPF